MVEATKGGRGLSRSKSTVGDNSGEHAEEPE